VGRFGQRLPSRHRGGQRQHEPKDHLMHGRPSI
jgi:hypothetical protein